VEKDKEVLHHGLVGGRKWCLSLSNSKTKKNCWSPIGPISRDFVTEEGVHHDLNGTSETRETQSEIGPWGGVQITNTGKSHQEGNLVKETKKKT